MSEISQQKQRLEAPIFCPGCGTKIRHVCDKCNHSVVATLRDPAFAPELAAEVEKLKNLLPETIACERCGRRDGLDAVVPHDKWAEISGRGDGGGFLCLWCMDKIAADKGIEQEVVLHFAGRALYGTDLGHAALDQRDSLAAENERLKEQLRLCNIDQCNAEAETAMKQAHIDSATFRLKEVTAQRDQLLEACRDGRRTLIAAVEVGTEDLPDFDATEHVTVKKLTAAIASGEKKP